MVDKMTRYSDHSFVARPEMSTLHANSHAHTHTHMLRAYVSLVTSLVVTPTGITKITGENNWAEMFISEQTEIYLGLCQAVCSQRLLKQVLHHGMRMTSAKDRLVVSLR